MPVETAAGVEPQRVILATASIHSRRAQELRETGIEVVEPEDADRGARRCERSNGSSYGPVLPRRGRFSGIALR